MMGVMEKIKATLDYDRNVFKRTGARLPGLSAYLLSLFDARIA
jgi:hypothetical protein